MCHGQMLGDALRKARKVHRCAACRLPIDVGKKYRDRAWEFEGEFSYGKICIRCATRGHVAANDGDMNCELFTPTEDMVRESVISAVFYKGYEGARKMLREARNRVLGK